MIWVYEDIVVEYVSREIRVASLILSRLKSFVIYFLACLESRKSWLQRYDVGKLGGDGYQIERNVSSSDVVDPSSDWVSDSELFPKHLCDNFLALVICSEGCDIASFRVQEHWQVSAAHIVPLSIFLNELWIRRLVK